jgi:hypothetical protein
MWTRVVGKEQFPEGVEIKVKWGTGGILAIAVYAWDGDILIDDVDEVQVCCWLRRRGWGRHWQAGETVVLLA